ncbi:hypothetical protein PG994_010066 [Apiospora phragmitis]|uniref:EH domain-containing protein n=1 Tax=Apiospora phragmitis TaxID=2905665 RepID=A0ABR1TR25_9PEZI
MPPRRPASVQSLPARKPVPPPAPPRRAQAQTSIPFSSLTNATQAGILASSRASPSATSRAPPPLPPPPRKQTPHMRQTLRQPPKSDEDEEKDHRNRHKKKHLTNKKKHAHHEGARRRWREQITERERKRYEGVWASNRGLLLTPSSFPTVVPPSSGTTAANASASAPNLLLHNRRPSHNHRNNSSGGSSPASDTLDPADFVANLVARDIWSRSRLPWDELAEVWDLVDSRGVGALDKTEFVVGMWLIDQRLRGRKIPQKVSESVWSSARGDTSGSRRRRRRRGIIRIGRGIGDQHRRKERKAREGKEMRRSVLSITWVVVIEKERRFSLSRLVFFLSCHGGNDGKKEGLFREGPLSFPTPICLPSRREDVCHEHT